MTKAKLKDATKDLLKDAETVMESVSSVRKGADELAQALRKFETQYTREEEQRRAEEKQAEQQRLVQQLTPRRIPCLTPKRRSGGETGAQDGCR